MGMTFDELKEIVVNLHEFNPMMGHRGCRLDVTYPEIGVMQTKAIIEAAINVNNEGMNVIPEIMIPLIGDIKEMKYVKGIIIVQDVAGISVTIQKNHYVKIVTVVILTVHMMFMK